MKTFGILFCSILMFCFSVSAKEVEGDNNYVKKSFQVDDFYKVKTNGAFNIVYHQSKDSAGLIKMYGEENILNSMKVESKEGVLNIKFDSPSKKDFGVVILDIFSSALNEVENDGGAVFETGGHIAGSEVYFLLMGNGQIRTGELDYGIVRAKILTGSGDIFLKIPLVIARNLRLQNQVRDRHPGFPSCKLIYRSSRGQSHCAICFRILFPNV